MTMRNLVIAMMILIVLAAALTVRALNTSVVSAAIRPTVTVKIPYRTGTASRPTTRIVPAPVADPGGTPFTGTGDASAGSWVAPAIPQ
jgi:hypothetical protein